MVGVLVHADAVTKTEEQEQRLGGPSRADLRLCRSGATTRAIWRGCCVHACVGGIKRYLIRYIRYTTYVLYIQGTTCRQGRELSSLRVLYTTFLSRRCRLQHKVLYRSGLTHGNVHRYKSRAIDVYKFRVTELLLSLFLYTAAILLVQFNQTKYYENWYSVSDRAKQPQLGPCSALHPC